VNGPARSDGLLTGALRDAAGRRRAASPPSLGERLGRALAAEWTKFWSVRSTVVALSATVVLSLAIDALATATEAAHWHQQAPFSRLTFDPTSLSLTGLLFGQLALGVLGVLVVSAEHGTGTIRGTYLAVPQRWLVLVAKALVFGFVALVVGEVCAFAAFFLGQAILHGTTPTATLAQPGVLRAVAGGGLYLCVLGLLALGIGACVRHSAGAISTFVGVLFVLPLIDQALPSGLRDTAAKFLPATIGAAMTAVRLTPEQAGEAFSPWVGFGLLCAYAVAVGLLAAWLAERRDA
jgi:hypothetical protein